MIGLVAYTVASLLCAFAPVNTRVCRSARGAGLAGSAGIVIARTVVRDLYSGIDLARFFSFTILVNGLAPILAPVIGGQMMAFTTWRGVFVLLTVIGAGLVLLGALGLPESLPAERRTSGGVSATFETFRTLLSEALGQQVALARYVPGAVSVETGCTATACPAHARTPCYLLHKGALLS